MLTRVLFLLACLLGSVAPALAQTPMVARVVASCGAVTYTAGGNSPALQDINGNFCTSASVSASISGFAPATTGTPISVTASAGGVTGTLPAGAVVVASNVGTTNIAYCKLGATSTTSDQPIAPNGGWFAFTVGVATQLTCITSTSTTTVNMVGGAGLPTGTGGGGGGSGGGGAVTIADGADVTQGALADAACATDNGSCTVAALVKRNNQRLTTLNTTLGSPFQAGGSIGNTTFAATQGTAANLNATVVGTGTFATQSAVTAASGSYSSGAFAAGSQVDLLTMRGTKAPGTAAANSALVGGVYTSGGVTLTDGQQAAWQLTSAGSGHVTVDNSTTAVATNAAIAATASAVASPVWGYNSVFDGTNWQPMAGTSAGVTVRQPTAANLNATVVGTGTFTTQAAQSGAYTVGQLGPYPVGATPYTATATGTTGATTATLAGASSVTTYLCGFSIRANATAAATGNATVTGVITATLNFTQWTAPNASGLGITEMIFAPCVPASGTNQSVAVVSAAPGTGGVVSVTAWGYKL